MKCFYHRSDFDGHCSGAIVKHKYPECEMIGADYNDAPPLMQEGEVIFVVDICFKPEDMKRLANHHKLIWIDHHETSIDKIYKSGIHPDGLRSVEFSGCELTWMFLFPDNEMPQAVRYLGRYDIWDHENPHVLAFQYGLREGINTLPDTPIWKELFEPGTTEKFLVNNFIKTGETILRYQNRQNEIYAKGMAYEAEFEGLRAIVMNKPFTNSKAFDSVYDPEKHDIMILFGVKPDECKYTLYSDKPEIHVGKIAEKHGGGGHAGAAGFYSKKLVV